SIEKFGCNPRSDRESGSPAPFVGRFPHKGRSAAGDDAYAIDLELSWRGRFDEQPEDPALGLFVAEVGRLVEPRREGKDAYAYGARCRARTDGARAEASNRRGFEKVAARHVVWHRISLRQAPPRILRRRRRDRA